MNNLLYIYQLNNYEIGRSLKHSYKTIFKKRAPAKPQFNLKAILILILSYLFWAGVSVSFFFAFNWYAGLVSFFLGWFFRPLYMALARLVYYIPEKHKGDKYIKEAQVKAASFPNLKTVAITGSAGKTSTKDVLYSLLSNKTLKTPKSYNTKEKIAKVIDLELNHRYKNFIVEAGATKIGDVKELCNVTKPSIGILTSINEQHLERFKDIENTVSAKFELLQNLKEPSLGIVNLDDGLIYENLKKAKVMRLIGYSIEGKACELCQSVVLAKNIRWENGLTVFELVLYNAEHTYATPLIGKHHLSNLLAAIICAVELGEKPEDLKERIKNLESLPKRMELNTHNGKRIIDDTYGSNISGFKEALRILNTFEGKKVIATPGIYEIGEKSKEVHKMLGNLSSRVCDLIILLGKSQRTDAIMIGALENNYSKDKIIRLNDHKEVFRFIDKNLKEGDCVLLENTPQEQF